MNFKIIGNGLSKSRFYVIIYFKRTGMKVMELLEVLDENGKQIGTIMEKNKVHNEGLYHREVALILLNNKGEILLQKRASTKEIEPNKWAWHGGHQIAGEESIDAIIRETKEELGLTLPKDQIKELVELKRDKYPNRQFTTAYYSICNLKSEDFNIQKEELSEVKWFTFQEFKNMIYTNNPNMMFKNNENTSRIINALEKVIKSFKY